MKIHALSQEHVDGLIALFRQVPERDLTFIKEEVSDPDLIRSWPDTPGQLVALDGDSVVGYALLRPLSGWSDHVCELRVIVHPQSRGQGVGRALAQRALKDALEGGKRKVMVELAAEQEGAQAMFTGLGFTGEALLRDHIRDREGTLRDLVVLAYLAEDARATLDTIGLGHGAGL